MHADAGFDFFEVFCDTPIEECEKRDPKGLYAKARAGEISQFTGIDSPYQAPVNPDLRLTPDATVEEQAQRIIDLLESRGLAAGSARLRRNRVVGWHNPVSAHVGEGGVCRAGNGSARRRCPTERW